jgi:hypothetical protein
MPIKLPTGSFFIAYLKSKIVNKFQKKAVLKLIIFYGLNLPAKQESK